MGGAADVADLVLRARAGNRKAFGRLYELYADQIYGYAYARLSNPADAEDATELTFLRAFENMGKYELRGAPFVSWLYRIAHNLIVDRYRSGGKVISVDFEEQHVPTVREDPSEVFQRNSGCEDLYRAISRLTDEQREVVVLRFLDGRRTSDVADIMGRSEGSVRSLQWRALRSLERELSRAPEPAADRRCAGIRR